MAADLQCCPVQTCIASWAQPNARLTDGVPSSTRNKTKHVSQRQAGHWHSQLHCCQQYPHTQLTMTHQHPQPRPLLWGFQRQEVTTAITHSAPSRLMSTGTVAGPQRTVTAAPAPWHPCPHPGSLTPPWVLLGACCNNVANAPLSHRQPKPSKDPLPA